MNVKQTVRQRGVALQGVDVQAIIAIARSVKGMPTPELGQSFLTGVWLDWRIGEDKTAAKGVETFFDLYFATHGNMDRIEKIVTDTIPEELRAEFIAEAQELAERNIKLAKEHGPPCVVEVGASRIGPNSTFGPMQGDPLPN